ncbi:MAG: hypothetical protein HQ498_05545, partial [Pseudohongiella sp.]|nr:hypothetical protein [Pseudohongiella sp.]
MTASILRHSRLGLWLLLLVVQGFTVPVALAQTAAPTLLISGASEELERNIRAHVSMTGLACDLSTPRLNRLLPDIRQNLLRASRALGFYQLTSQISLEQTDTCWNLHVAVTPGAPVTVANIAITLNGSETSFSSMLDELPIQRGDTLNHAKYERLKSDLSALAVEQGFFAARFASSQLLLDLENNTVDIAIDFQPGERFHFGNIDIVPIAELSNEFIKRYIEFSENSFYSAEALIDLRNALNNSLYFSEVSVTPALGEAVDQRVPIHVALRMRPRQVYSVGGGITTDIGPRVRADYEDRYLNASGHTFEVKTGASPIQQNMDMNYLIPMLRPATQRLQISSGFLREDNDTYQNLTSKLGVTYSFINAHNWRQNYFTNYQHDDYTLNDEIEVADILIAGININRTRADDALYPTRG